MSFSPQFVPGGIYLRTSTGELIGRFDSPGAPFATLAEARDSADWLEMVVQLQAAYRSRDNVASNLANRDVTNEQGVTTFGHLPGG